MYKGCTSDDRAGRCGNRSPTTKMVRDPLDDIHFRVDSGPRHKPSKRVKVVTVSLDRLRRLTGSLLDAVRRILCC